MAGDMANMWISTCAPEVNKTDQVFWILQSTSLGKKDQNDNRGALEHLFQNFPIITKPGVCT